MSRSRNSRKGSKHVKGCPGCSQCDSNWESRNEPLSDDEVPVDYRGVIRGHNVAVTYVGDDKIFVAKAPALPGCMAHGDSVDEALEEIGVAIDLHLAVAADRPL